ncbi:pyridoxamine 5'-phosphate oxidase family protein [Candidatus Uhrbacteria bacterium]|nr:pyridoxamine 5'-phosphate oxidase family protein [Candidatus Uhrbacteria bacterium]
MKNALNFLIKQKLMAIACADGQGPWIANVYYGAGDDGRMYFISSKKNRHSRMILKDPHIAFSIAWFDPANHKNRKAIQGLGTCRPAKNLAEITAGIKLMYNKFPDLRAILTVKWIKTNAWGSKVWVLMPTYLKYWDDELYGEDESKEFFMSHGEK